MLLRYYNELISRANATLVSYELSVDAAFEETWIESNAAHLNGLSEV